MIILPSGKIHVDDERIRQVFISHIQKHFKFDIRDRITIKSDVNQFKFMEDKFVWEQAREKRPHYHEVYWDGVWICDYSDGDKVADTMRKFFFGFKNAYEAGQISLNTQQDMANIQAQEMIAQAIADQKKAEVQSLKQAEEQIEKLPESTVEDKLSKEVLKEIVEEKKNYKQKRSRK